MTLNHHVAVVLDHVCWLGENMDRQNPEEDEVQESWDNIPVDVRNVIRDIYIQIGGRP